MFDYDITIIIPVYNAADFLERCVLSLLKQTHPFNRIEVLMINDGSTDASGRVCETLAKKYKNIKTITQPNGGVSSARNLGLKNASGKYLFFLDADDRLSDNAVEELFGFFEKHYDEVDIVSCLIFNDTNGVLTPHIRNKVITETRVYDVDTDIYLSQTNINVCVKNDGEENILFDTAMKMGEDEKRNNQIIMRKRKIGYCHKAMYYYTRHGESSSGSGNKPYYAFDEFMKYYEELTATYTFDGKVHPYIQAIVLYGLSWRLENGLLIPHHLEGALKDTADERLSALMGKIGNRIIVDSPHVDYFHRLFFIRLKRTGQLELTLNENGYRIAAADGTVCYAEPCFKVRITKIFIRNNRLFMEGHTYSPVTDLARPRVFVDYNGEKTELVLKDSTFGRIGGEFQTNRFYCFQTALAVEGALDVGFEARVGPVSYKTELSFSEQASLNDTRKRIYQNGYTVRFNDSANRVAVKKAGFKEKALTLLALDKLYLKFDWKVFLYRKAALTKTRRKIWLYSDRQGFLDNAYFQFKHDFSKKDGVKRYYIVDKPKNPEAYFTRKERRRLVGFKDLKHRLLYLRCDKILTSFVRGSVVSNYDIGSSHWYSDLLRHEVIGLQHGVLLANLPMMYAKERCEADRIVVSSRYEIDNFINNYGCDEEDLIPCGMPRFDRIDTQTPPQRKIILCPSWRSSLIGEYRNHARKLNDAAFLASDFYRSVNEVLNSEDLAAVLEKYDITLDFKNHPLFAGYDRHFESDNPRVRVLGGEARLEEYLVMITDYSSIVFDFVYLERPVIYFMPDYTLFKAGVTHYYRSLGIPLEDGFGEFTQTAGELAGALRRLAENDFKPAPQYAEKMKGFFLNKGKNHSDKLYEALMKD